MAGLPEVDSISDYGSAKTDYAPVEDQTTDLSAAHHNLIAMNVAGLTEVAPRAWVRFLGHATTPTDPASNVHAAVWGHAALVKPTVVHTSTGLYTITWPTTVTDALNVVHTLALFTGWANTEGATLYFPQVTVTSANVAVVRVFNSSVTLADAAGVTFSVFVR